jgi:hypothetical protein
MSNITKTDVAALALFSTEQRKKRQKKCGLKGNLIAETVTGVLQMIVINSSLSWI